jgi:hypothetical protein
MKPSKIDILNSVYGYYNFSSKSKFADFLGIKTTTLNNWYRRKTLVYEILIEKCDDIDLHILFTKGEALPAKKRSEEKITHSEADDNSNSLLPLLKEKDLKIIEMSEKIGRLTEQIKQFEKSR